ncbi:hypothetical protein CCP3SC15_4040001 [Gammaproteobacteria bacterium]
MRDVLVESLDTTIATKADVRELKSELKADITRLENRIDLMHKDIQAMELRLTMKLGSLIAAAVGILIAVLRVAH